MNALILLSHGSRMEPSNLEMMTLTSRLSAVQNNMFSEVVHAFQQFASPSFKEVVDDLIHRGIRQVVVFPLFLSSGSHVREDLPVMIEAARNRHPQLEISAMPHLGGTDGLARYLMESVSDHLSVGQRVGHHDA